MKKKLPMWRMDMLGLIILFVLLLAASQCMGQDYRVLDREPVTEELQQDYTLESLKEVYSPILFYIDFTYRFIWEKEDQEYFITTLDMELLKDFMVQLQVMRAVADPTNPEYMAVVEEGRIAFDKMRVDGN